MPSPPSYSRRMRLSLSTKYDHVPDIDQVRDRNDLRLKNRFESIFNKYERDFSEVGDVIDLESGEVIVDNGHLGAMRSERDTGSRHTGSRRVILGPDQPDQDELSSTTRLTNGPSFQNSYFQMPQFPHVPPFNQQQQYTPQMVAMPVMMPTQPTNQLDPAHMQQYIDRRIAEQIEAYHRSRTSQTHTQLRIDNNAWQIPDVSNGSMIPERAVRSHLRPRARQSLPVLRRRSFSSDAVSDAEEDTVWRTSGRFVSFTGGESESEGHEEEDGGNASTGPLDSFADSMHVRVHQKQNEPWPPRRTKRSKADLANERLLDEAVQEGEHVSKTVIGKQRGPGRPRKNHAIYLPGKRNAQSQHPQLQSHLEQRATIPTNTKKDDRMRSASLSNSVNAGQGDGSRAEPSFARHALTVQADAGRHRRAFTKDEDELILRLVQEYGLDWNVIAEHFPDRSPRTLYGRWRKQLRQANKQLVPDESEVTKTGSRHIDSQLPGKPNSRNRRNSEPLFLTFPPRTRSPWPAEETELLIRLRTIDKLSWTQIRDYFPSRSLGCITGHLSYALRERNFSRSNSGRRGNEVGGQRTKDARDSSDTSTLSKLPNRLSELHQQDPEPPTIKTSLVSRKEDLVSKDLNRVASTTSTEPSRNNNVSQASDTQFDSNTSVSHDIGGSSRAIDLSKDVLRDPKGRSLILLDSSKKTKISETVTPKLPLLSQGAGHEGTVTTTNEAYRNDQHKTLKHSLNPRKRKRLSEPMPSRTINNKQRTIPADSNALLQTPQSRTPVKASDTTSKLFSAPRSLPTRLILDDDLGSEDELH